jgi:hypothetical protein
MFRIVGAATVSFGAPGSVTLLRFEHEGTAHFFKEKAGVLDAGDFKARLILDSKSTSCEASPLMLMELCGEFPTAC